MIFGIISVFFKSQYRHQYYPNKHVLKIMIMSYSLVPYVILELLPSCHPGVVRYALHHNFGHCPALATYLLACLLAYDDVVNREDTVVTENTVMYIVNKIKKNKEQRMRLYAKLGAELAELKNNYMVDKCPKCFVNTDIYAVINCQKCVKANNIKVFL